MHNLCYNVSAYYTTLYIEVVLKAIGLAKVALTFTLTFNLLSFSLGKIQNNLFVRHKLYGAVMVVFVWYLDL